MSLEWRPQSIKCRQSRGGGGRGRLLLLLAAAGAVAAAAAVLLLLLLPLLLLLLLLMLVLFIPEQPQHHWSFMPHGGSSGFKNATRAFNVLCFSPLLPHRAACTLGQVYSVS